MKNHKDLTNKLFEIDRKGYKAYKNIQGQYKFDSYILSIDSVQSDPFASPSKVRIILSQEDGNFPKELFDKSYKNTAVCDFLTRLFSQNIKKYYNRDGGSGKSGLLAIDSCGQEILPRTSITIDENKIEARLEVGLPAAGRSVLGRVANAIFAEALPNIVKKTLFFNQINSSALKKQVELVEDQTYLRKELKTRKLVAFIANDSILPRESGVSSKPLRKGAIPFKSPSSLEVAINLPHRGQIKGMGIPEGITLIVGGGYHGKSTLLKALELGVYNHISGDGREYVITRESAAKIRAEDGRQVEKVDISPFINNLPNGQHTLKFSTENASGSTSQAANIIEALEVGTDLLLIDEDTCATNFMIRDEKMQRLVKKEKEPITPFVDRVRQLYENLGVSTIMVAGSSGDYFQVADHVIMIDEYVPKDVTMDAKDIIKDMGYYERIEKLDPLYIPNSRVLLKSSFPKTYKGVKIKSKGLHTLLYNKTDVDLKYLEQLVDTSQANTIALIFQYMMNHLVNDRLSLKEIIEKIYEIIERKGLDELSPYKGHPGNLALPRKHEIACALNRFRNLKVK